MNIFQTSAHDVHEARRVAMGGRINTVWCLVEPLREGSMRAYLMAQTRDVQEGPPAPWLTLAT